MKIIINYDLIEKIKEAKTGFSLIKTSKKILLKSTIAEMFYIVIKILSSSSFNNIIRNGVPLFFYYLTFYYFFETLSIKENKVKALEDIKKIAIKFKDLNICTNAELLLDSYVYEKEHKLIEQSDSVLPKINQKKYIMVPVYDDGEIKEISLLQEHIMGTKYYVISYGEPNKQKVFRPAFGSI